MLDIHGSLSRHVMSLVLRNILPKVYLCGANLASPNNPSVTVSKIGCNMRKPSEEAGCDSLGNVYSSRKEMWKVEVGEGTGGLANDDKRKSWYAKGINYWKSVDATIDGVLGGYGNVSDTDVLESAEFIREVFTDRSTSSGTNLVALDCGAGVGRVTKNLLLKFFNEVDLVEPLEHFLQAAQQSLANEVSSIGDHKAVNFFCTPLEDFTPHSDRYDVIWVQWCIGHLTDLDFVNFFERSKVGLKPGGIFILKENIAQSGFVVDKEDSSVTRSDALFRKLFREAGLHILKTKKQEEFPKELFQVQMYALSPMKRTVNFAASPTMRSKKSRSIKPGLIS